MIAIFILDLIAPLGFAIGVSYLIPIAFLIKLSKPYWEFRGAVLASILVVFGFVLKDGANSSWMVYCNRGLSLLAIWVTAIGVAKFQQSVIDAQKIQAQSEKHFRNLVEGIHDYSIILLDAEGIITIWNKGAEEIHGFKKEEIQGQSFSKLFLEEDLKIGKPQDILNRVKEEGTVRYQDWRRTKNGTKFWAMSTVTAIYDEGGTCKGFTKMVRDMSQAKALQEEKQQYVDQLEIKNKELEQFTYIASHDLQEPLRTISSFAELIHKTEKDNLSALGRKSLGFVIQGSARMSTLIKGLLDYSRIGRNPILEEVNLNQLVLDVLEDMQLTIKESKAKISLGNLPTIHAFKIEVRLLFQNLISNAIKFCPKTRSPIVEIGAKQIPLGWELFVQDNGIGIEDNHLSRIFTIFQRLNVRDEFEGTGIGLSHCKKIVDLHGGKIWVESIPDNGSRFYFILPEKRNHEI